MRRFFFVRVNRTKVSLVGIALMPSLPFHWCGGLSRKLFVPELSPKFSTSPPINSGVRGLGTATVPLCLSSSLRGRRMTSLVRRSIPVSHGQHNGSYKKTPVVHIMNMLTKIFVLVSLTFVFFVALSYLYVTDRLNWNAIEGFYVAVASKFLGLFS